MGRGLIFALLTASLASAQYEVARKVNEYPAHAAWPRFEIGAEYLVRSIPTENGSLYARDYLVVEVAIYPRKDPVTIAAAHFMLRVNGSKSALFAESVGFVAASLKYPDWEQHPVLVGTAGIGDGSVIVGAPTPMGRFPGDRTAGGPMNMPRKQPDNKNAAGQPKEYIPLIELLEHASLSEGEARVPRKGCLFFAYKGKLKSIRKLELLYDDGHGDHGGLPITGQGATP